MAGGVQPPYSHDVALLLSKHQGTVVPTDVESAANTVASFVTLTRYPGFVPVGQSDFLVAETAMLKVKAWCLAEIARIYA